MGTPRQAGRGGGRRDEDRPARRPHPPASVRGKAGRKPPGDSGAEPRTGRPAGLELGVGLVYEDDEVLVVEKPTGLVTAPMPGTADATRSEIPSVFAAVKRYVRSKRRRGGRAWIIHRLDKEASGLLVFAKTERAYEWLKEDFRSRRVQRLYLAVVEGEFAESARAGTIQSFVSEDNSGLMKSTQGRSTGALPRAREFQPQLAVTHYRVIESAQGRSLVQVRLATGRKNQIRVHMSEAGHPLVGDYRYRPAHDRAPAGDPLKRLCLHATELGFTHPSTGQSVRFHSTAPEGFWRLVGKEPPPGTLGRVDDPARDRSFHPGEVQDGVPGSSPGPLPGAVHAMAGSGASPAQVATSWDHVAGWYERLIGENRSDHYRDVILPGMLRLLRPSTGMRVLDVACGEGVLCRRLSRLGVAAVGIDASEKLVGSARHSAGASARAGVAPARFEVGDARALGELSLGTFDSAACVMALMNIDPLEPVFRGIAGVLKPGGALVAVILHPAFRAPGQTSWAWDEKPGHKPHGHEQRPSAPEARQYRRVDGYLSPGQTQIVMNPGAAAAGQEAVTTWTFHRPIQTYVRLLGETGFAIEALEEWPSLRKSRPGPRAREENRARREIPLFLGFRAIKRT